MDHRHGVVRDIQYEGEEETSMRYLSRATRKHGDPQNLETQRKTTRRTSGTLVIAILKAATSWWIAEWEQRRMWYKSQRAEVEI